MPRLTKVVGPVSGIVGNANDNYSQPPCGEYKGEYRKLFSNSVLRYCLRGWLGIYQRIVLLAETRTAILAWR